MSKSKVIIKKTRAGSHIGPDIYQNNIGEPVAFPARIKIERACEILGVETPVVWKPLKVA